MCAFRKSFVVYFTLFILVGSMVYFPQNAKPVPMVSEFRCGDDLAGMSNVTLDDGTTDVPIGCLCQIMDTMGTPDKAEQRLAGGRSGY